MAYFILVVPQQYTNEAQVTKSSERKTFLFRAYILCDEVSESHMSGYRWLIRICSTSPERFTFV